MAASPRFSVVRIKHGPCVVVDPARYRKIVARSFEPDDAADALARLMNGDVGSAMASRDTAIASLGPARGHKGGGKIGARAAVGRLLARLAWPRKSRVKRQTRALF